MKTLGRILSIQTGRVQTCDGDTSEHWSSAIRKAKVMGAVQVHQTGIMGDRTRLSLPTPPNITTSGIPSFPASLLTPVALVKISPWRIWMNHSAASATHFEWAIASWRFHNPVSRAGNCRGGGTCPGWQYLCSKTAEPVGIFVS